MNAYLDVGDLAADAHSATDNFVADNDGVLGAAPGLYTVGVSFGQCSGQEDG
jgi:hypothetical protein